MVIAKAFTIQVNKVLDEITAIPMNTSTLPLPPPILPPSDIPAPSTSSSLSLSAPSAAAASASNRLPAAVMEDEDVAVSARPSVITSSASSVLEESTASPGVDTDKAFNAVASRLLSRLSTQGS